MQVHNLSVVFYHCIVVFNNSVTDDSSAGHGCDAILFQVCIQIEASPLVEDSYVCITVLLFLIVERGLRVTRDAVVQVAYDCAIFQNLLLLGGDAVVLSKLCEACRELQCIKHCNSASAVANEAKHGLERSSHAICEHICSIGLAVHADDRCTVPCLLADELVLIALVSNPQQESVNVGVLLLTHCYRLCTEVVSLLDGFHAVHPLIPSASTQQVLAEHHLPLVHVSTLLATRCLDVETSRDVKDVCVLVSRESLSYANLFITRLVEYRGDVLILVNINLDTVELNLSREYRCHNTHDTTSMYLMYVSIISLNGTSASYHSPCQ